ncbi:MAG: branched-chain amino acid ABC transporter permease [Anaerolineales bacterium]|jgi:branched-chain amino acid transport system permease protein|nr:branched-chain amino acid ABC transporter permease [Anaerolineales bacterium]
MIHLDALAQVAVSGVLLGGLYGLAALGLSLMFGVLKILNVAHGELIMLGGYAAFWGFSLYGLDPFVALLLIVPLMFALGLGLHLGLFQWIVRAEEQPRIKNSLLIGFGLTLILHNVVIFMWGADDRAITTAYSLNALTLAGVRIPVARAAGFLISMLCAFGMEWLLERTDFGNSIRATAEDWRHAALTGINIQRVYLWTVAIGSALAGVAGMLVSLGYSVSPSVGLAWTLKALIVVVLAGLGSMRGTFFAGILLGVAESVGTYLIPNGGQYREAIGILLFLVVLSLRPQGLFGAKLG